MPSLKRRLFLALPILGWTKLPDTQLQIGASVVLDGSGNGQITLGPSITREHWDLVSADVSVSTAVLEATCVLYQATGPTPTQRLGGTATGSTGDTCGLTGVTLMPGQVILAVWAGGDAGKTATLAIVGTKGRYGQ